MKKSIQIKKKNKNASRDRIKPSKQESEPIPERKAENEAKKVI